jgi:hypothetical protein
MLTIAMAKATLVLDGYAKSDALSDIVCHVHFSGLVEPAASRVMSFWLPKNEGATGNATVTFKVPSLATGVCVTLVWRYRGGWLRHGRCRFSQIPEPTRPSHLVKTSKSLKALKDSKDPHSSLWPLTKSPQIQIQSQKSPQIQLQSQKSPQIQLQSQKSPQIQLQSKGLDAKNPKPKWNLDETRQLLFESTLMHNGTATLSFPEVSGLGFRGNTEPGPALIREWFYLAENSREPLSRFLQQCLWYTRLTPIDEGVRKVHMPYWNNKPDSLPGWFFAFEKCAKPRYKHADFLEVFTAAKCGILGIDDAVVVDKHKQQRLVLAWGLCIFGLSIQYQADVHFGHENEPVERFSSNARFDGVGDCEDIAKEICMAHKDLCAISDTKDFNLVNIKARARQYKCVIMLGTVARYSAPNKTLAHAFAMLVPNWFFGGTKGINDPDGPMLCDGTYPAYPTIHEEWKRPWGHIHIVSALILDEGEIYFIDNDVKTEHSYGISFHDMFPIIKSNVSFASTHDPLCPEDVEHVQGMLASNMPIQKYTFGFEHQSIVSRFVSTWSKKAGDFEYLNRYCDNGLGDPSYFEKADHCLDQAGYDRLMAKTSTFGEMAFTMKEGGQLVETHNGEYGSVSRGHAELGVGGHTHHRERGKDYRSFNVPTPEDVMTFTTHRAFAIVNGLDHARESELVVTHNNIYELADMDDASGLVAEMVAKFKSWSPKKTTPSVLLMDVWRAVSKVFVRRGVYDNERGLEWKDCLVTKFFSPDVFTKQAVQDAYISIFENSIGVTIKQVPVLEYEATCGLHRPKE